MGTLSKVYKSRPAARPAWGDHKELMGHGYEAAVHIPYVLGMMQKRVARGLPGLTREVVVSRKRSSSTNRVVLPICSRCGESSKHVQDARCADAKACEKRAEKWG